MILNLQYDQKRSSCYFNLFMIIRPYCELCEYNLYFDTPLACIRDLVLVFLQNETQPCLSFSALMFDLLNPSS